MLPSGSLTTGKRASVRAKPSSRRQSLSGAQFNPVKGHHGSREQVPDLIGFVRLRLSKKPHPPQCHPISFLHCVPPYGCGFRAFGGPALAERHAVTHEVSGYICCVLEPAGLRRHSAVCLSAIASTVASRAAFAVAPAVWGRTTNAASPRRQTLSKTVRGTTTSTIVCTNGSGVAATSSASFG